jgi:cytochrome b pre-mRNA-processing protein 3
MSLFSRLFARSHEQEVMRPLYNAVIARGREPHWYRDGKVPDTIDGRFEMIAAVLSLVYARLEQESDQGQHVAWLTELFVADMDSQLREIGIGDMVVGKHVGRMMSALGGRIGAYGDGLKQGTFEAALVRNLYRGEEPPTAALEHSAENLRAFYLGLHQMTADAIVAGTLP